MFDKKKKESSDYKAPKHTTFGNDSDDEEEMLEEAPDAGNILKELDGAIGKSKQREKNATIAGVYSSTKTKTATKNINACGCFGG